MVLDLPLFLGSRVFPLPVALRIDYREFITSAFVVTSHLRRNCAVEALGRVVLSGPGDVFRLEGNFLEEGDSLLASNFSSHALVVSPLVDFRVLARVRHSFSSPVDLAEVAIISLLVNFLELDVALGAESL